MAFISAWFSLTIVSEILYGKTVPYRSIVEIQRGDVVSDLGHFYQQVESVPSFVNLETFFIVRQWSMEFLFTTAG